MSTTTATTPPAAHALSPPGAGRGRERLLTAADLVFFPTSLATGDVDYELDNGRLVVMAPPGGDHGRKQARFIRELFAKGEDLGHGVVIGEAMIVLRRRPDRLVAPDAAFVAAKSVPLRYSPEGYFETVPELVVEVRSKNDTTPEVEAKVREYLAAGVVLVWVADPGAASVTTYRADAPPRVYAAGDTLDADPVIPDFAVPLVDLFRP